MILIIYSLRSRTMSDVDGDDDDSMALTPVVGEAREDKKNISALARVRDGLHKVKVLVQQ